MRILTYGLSADKLGGIETFLLNMNQHMSDDCVFDYVIERSETIGESTIHQKAIDAKGGRVYYVAPKRNMAQSIKDWMRLLKEHGQEYSVVYFNVYAMSWFLPMILCRCKGLKVFIHAHNNMLHDCGVFIKILHRIGRIAMNGKRYYRLTNSDLSSKFMFGDTKREVLVYNAVSMKRFGFRADVRKDIRNRMNLTDKHVYGFAGRIVYQKNPLYLIDLFANIQEKDDKAILMMAGDGDMMNDVKLVIAQKGLSEHVILLGNVQSIEDYYQAMDVFLLPSRFEGLGIVLIEAQAAGLPCIASAEVVPQEAKVTELLEYVPLSEPDRWVNIAIEMASRSIERGMYRSIIADSRFNIETEAKRLEGILMDWIVWRGNNDTNSIRESTNWCDQH